MIVSCGSIDSSKLLMLSGVGPAGQLREVGVDVVVDSPGVGENLQDHAEGVIMWEARQRSVPFDMNTARWGYPTSENAFCLTPNVTKAKSRGTVRLQTRDFRDKPKVDPRYFTHEHDIRVMTYGLKPARRIAAQPALGGWAGAELAPGPDVRTDD